MDAVADLLTRYPELEGFRFLTYGSDDEAGNDVAGHDGADKADAS
jgi:hypothetical protein